MTPWTTPTFQLRLLAKSGSDPIDLSMAEQMYVTISQTSSASVTKTGEYVEVEGDLVSVWLTQEETSKFHVGDAKIQLNWVYHSQDGSIRRSSTKVKRIIIEEQLLKRVIS